MKKEYVNKLAELSAKTDRTPEEEVLFNALVDYNEMEKTQPFDKPAVEEARQEVERIEREVA